MADLEKYLGKKVKIKSISNKEYEGKVVGIVPALDNEPEVDEIDILNEADNKNYELFLSEIISIKII